MSFGSRINASQEPTSDRTHIHTCGKNTLPSKSDGTGCVYMYQKQHSAPNRYAVLHFMLIQHLVNIWSSYNCVSMLCIFSSFNMLLFVVFQQVAKSSRCSMPMVFYHNIYKIIDKWINSSSFNIKSIFSRLLAIFTKFSLFFYYVLWKTPQHICKHI